MNSSSIFQKGNFFAKGLRVGSLFALVFGISSYFKGSEAYALPVIRIDLPVTLRLSDDAENVRIGKIKITKQVIAEKLDPNYRDCWNREEPCDAEEMIPIYGKVPTIEIIYESDEDSFMEGEMVPNPNNPDERIPSRTIKRYVFLKGDALPRQFNSQLQSGPYQKRVIDKKLSKFCPSMDEMERLGMNPWECEDKIVYKTVTTQGFTIRLSDGP